MRRKRRIRTNRLLLVRRTVGVCGQIITPITKAVIRLNMARKSGVPGSRLVIGVRPGWVTRVDGCEGLSRYFAIYRDFFCELILVTGVVCLLLQPVGIRCFCGE